MCLTGVRLLQGAVSCALRITGAISLQIMHYGLLYLQLLYLCHVRLFSLFLSDNFTHIPLYTNLRVHM